jgi:protein-S-isoprenylcysteine O-methyltransferase Ste14
MRKWWVVRQGFAVLVLPVMVVLAIPIWIARTAGTPASIPQSPWEWASAALGLCVSVAGVSLFAACLARFVSEGQGTLAPWDPPVRLVVGGPYAYVRNPMISGVILLLFAEGLVLRSVHHLGWAGLFFLINAVYIPLLEEPWLKRRFGRDYEDYRAGVPRLLPRLTPWRGRGSTTGGAT